MGSGERRAACCWGCGCVCSSSRWLTTGCCCLLRAAQGAADAANAGRAWAGIEHADIRFDEDYARFYEAYSGQISGQKRLPPPVEGRTLYSELGLLQQKQQLLAQHQGMLGSATPPPTQALLMGGGLTPGGGWWGVRVGVSAGQQQLRSVRAMRRACTCRRHSTLSISSTPSTPSSGSPCAVLTCPGARTRGDAVRP
jgi:hypothetical protein